jgi:hypothetical protein
MASWNAGALSASIRIDPSTQTVAPGTEFAVNLVHNADVPIKGIGTDVRFDQAKLELVRIDKGTDWGTTGLFFGLGTPEEVTTAANTTGLIPALTRYRPPGNPETISPGPKVFAIIIMRVRDGAAFGSIPLTIEKPEAVDQNYASLPTSKTDGVVVIGDVPTPTQTAAVTDTPSPTATATLTPVTADTATPAVPPLATDTPAGPTATPTETPGPGIPGTLGVSPVSQSVEDGAQFNTSVMQNLTVESSGVVADVSFNPGLLQVVDVQAGVDYPSADLTVGTLGQSRADAIAEANTTGTIKMILVYQGDSTVPAGLHEAFKLIMVAKPEVSGVSPITLKNVTFYATQQISVTRIDGMVEVLGPVPPTATPTITPVVTATPPPAATSTATAAATVTATVPAASTSTATAAATVTATVTTQAPTATKTNAPTATLPPAATNTPVPAATATTGAQATSTIAAIATSTPAPEATATTVSGATNTPGTAATNTPASGATATTAAGSATATKTTAAIVAGSPTVNAAAAQAKLNISPATITAPPGAEFTVILVQEAPFVTTGAQASFKFDPALIQVVGVEKSAAYQKAALVAGVQQTAAQAIAEANTTGTLKNVAAFFTPPASLPAGAAEFLRIKVKSSGTASNTTTAISLLDIEMLDKEGVPLTVAAANGQVTIQAGAAVPTPVGAASTVGSSNTVAGSSTSPANRLPNAGVADSYGELNWALTISLIAMLASGGALVGSLAKKPE